MHDEVNETEKRLAERGVCYPGTWKKQRYFLSVKERDFAAAEKPPRKPVDFQSLAKRKLMQALPSRQVRVSRNPESKHENDSKDPLSYCPNFTFDPSAATAPITAADLVNGKSPIRYQNYGQIGARVRDAYGSALYDALDAIRNIPLTVHNLSFAFDIPACNVGSKGRVSLREGTSITYQIFASGRVSVQALLTTRPISPSTLGQFMESIQTRLPFPTPQVETWEITLTDPAFDIPIEQGQRWIRHFKLPEFQHNGLRYHLYRRKLDGKMHLRVEYHAYPHINLIGYPDFVEQAKMMLLEACGKA